MVFKTKRDLKNLEDARNRERLAQAKARPPELDDGRNKKLGGYENGN